MATEYEDEYVEFDDCNATADTLMAVFVKCAELAKPLWVPKSVIHPDSEVYKVFTSGNLIISKNWATKRGII